MLASGEYYDLTIKCGQNSYKVHKNIVCTRAKFFRRAIRFGGKVRKKTCEKANLATCIILISQKETQESEIDLSAEDAAIIKLLVQYLYEAEYNPIISMSTVPINHRNQTLPQTASHTCPKSAKQNNWDPYNQNYNQCSWSCPHHYCGNNCSRTCEGFLCDKCISVEGDASQLLIHAQMYEIADKYDVTGLKTLSKEKFRWACMKFWDHPEFAQAAYHAYTTTPDGDKGLRGVVSKTLSDHMSLLLKPEVERLMVEFNRLSFDLLMAKAEQAGWCKK